VLAPAGVQEAAELTSYAFDLADSYQTPVLILADAIIGQMMEPVTLSALRSVYRGRKDWVLGKRKVKSQNIIRSLFIKEGALEAHNQKLLAKWEKIKKNQQKYSVYKAKDADYLIIAYGSQARIAQAAVDNLRKQKIKAGLFRPVSLWPYPDKALKEIAKGVKKILVVEQSLGQMVEDVRLTLCNSKIYFMGRAGGGIPQETEIVSWIKKNL
jgi:2-oxoglutarate ferredoxin oxidoreductase subunit alpha